MSNVVNEQSVDCGQCVNLSIEEKPAIDESDPSLCGISRMSPTPFERDPSFLQLTCTPSCVNYNFELRDPQMQIATQSRVRHTAVALAGVPGLLEWSCFFHSCFLALYSPSRAWRTRIVCVSLCSYATGAGFSLAPRSRVLSATAHTYIHTHPMRDLQVQIPCVHALLFP